MKKILLIAALVPVLLASCTKDPFASFISDRKVVEVGEEIYFTNRSYDAIDYEWDFGDGYLSRNFNAVHSWDAPGIYTVSLTAFGKDGKIDRAMMDIEVFRPMAELEITVEEYYEPYYLVEEARVRLYTTLDDFDNEENWIAQGYTNQNGKVLFVDVPANRAYYVDVWGPNHGNYDLSLDDINWVLTDLLVSGARNYFTAVVDYYPDGKKSGGVTRPEKVDRSNLPATESPRNKEDRSKPEGILQNIR